MESVHSVRNQKNLRNSELGKSLPLPRPNRDFVSLNSVPRNHSNRFAHWIESNDESPACNQQAGVAFSQQWRIGLVPKLVVAVRSVRVYPCAGWVVTNVYNVTDTGMPVFYQTIRHLPTLETLASWYAWWWQCQWMWLTALRWLQNINAVKLCSSPIATVRSSGFLLRQWIVLKNFRHIRSNVITTVTVRSCSVSCMSYGCFLA